MTGHVPSTKKARTVCDCRNVPIALLVSVYEKVRDWVQVAPEWIGSVERSAQAGRVVDERV